MLPCTEHCIHQLATLLLEEPDPQWKLISEDEVREALNCMDSKKDSKKCCSAGYFPDLWKTQYVTAVPKSSKDPTSVSSWRPISILHPISKCFEKVIGKRLRNFLEGRNAFGSNQFGFREGHSTELASLLITQFWADVNHSKVEIDAVFLDCTKAFDRVDPKVMLQKLEMFGVPTQCRRLVESYLSNRRQVVTVNGKSSDVLPVTSGVPQGSVLGPILFIALMSDTNTAVSPGTCLSLFADDILVSRPQETASDHSIFQPDLDNIAA
ncbi:hypothetical protein RvY_02893 [Ramazzottius varieornatus]|uniref:Reverse transcriptase domain-containing protein n=1 Tax=Ramazzottius varieornatus TaxID=947166 RepID=A0A1D1UL89_RAMVA|nr:hypothetical protein RvY_02893 [Ramazzottius varieornatus]